MDITLDVGDREVAALRLRAADAGGGASVHHDRGVIVVHDMLGVTPVLRGHAQRLAAAGYHVVAPDLFSGGGTRPACVVRAMQDFRRGQGQAWSVLDAARAELVGSLGVDPDRIGTVGFCMGGGFALWYARRAGLAVAAPFYGDTPPKGEDLSDLSDMCPVVGGWGGRDLIYAPKGRRLAEALQQAGVDHDIVIYPDAGHSYMDDHRSLIARLGRYTPMRASYQEDAAEDSWRRMLAFFARHL